VREEKATERDRFEDGVVGRVDS
jgi:hypothetical protein